MPLSGEFKAKVKNAHGLCERIDKARADQVECAIAAANDTIKDLEKINSAMSELVCRYREAGNKGVQEISVMTFNLKRIACEMYINLTGLISVREMSNKNTHSLQNFVFTELPSEAAYEGETGPESWDKEPSSFDPFMCLAVDYATRPLFSSLDDVARKYGIDASASLGEKSSGKKGK